MQRLWLTTSVLALLASSCASIPQPLQGEYPDTQPAQAGQYNIGGSVRWGGVIIATNPQPDQTCFEILGKPLEENQRPIEADQSEGRFIACKPGFQDPEVFKAGREITIIGKLDTLEPRMIGEYEYQYPILNAEVVYLWPERPDYAAYPNNYHPYFWPYHYPYYYPYHAYPRPYYRGGSRGYIGIRGKHHVP